MLNQPSKEFTKQEKLVAACLDELGLRYAQQVSCGPFYLDFLVESDIVIEADGVYGHFGKREKKRDEYILSCYNILIHIKEKTKKAIMEEIKEKVLWVE